MGLKTYNFLNRVGIGIAVPNELGKRIEENIEQSPLEIFNIDAKIKISQNKPFSEIVKDKSFAYQDFKENNQRNFPGWDYYRYNTHIRTIWKKGQSEYEVKTNIAGDENAGLICFRNICYRHPSIAPLHLIHASLASLNGKGILIAGKSRSGKTTLLTYLLESFGASFVSDENILLEKTPHGLVGHYLPKTIRARFSQVINSPLEYLLEDLEKTNATQYIDLDAIERIINAKAFYVDAGIAISRKVFTTSFGVDSLSSTLIDKIVFTGYNSSSFLERKDLGKEEAQNRLESMERHKKREISPGDLQEIKGNIPTSWLEGVTAEKLEFKDKQTLKEYNLRW